MKSDLIVHDRPKEPVSESVRLLRTNISYLAEKDNSKIFMLTSSAPGDGKSWLTSNLAASFAQSEKKVLIIDMDFRKGRQNRIFNIQKKDGFATYLKKRYIQQEEELDYMELYKDIIKTNVPNLYLLPTGPYPKNPSELIEVCDIGAIFSMLREKFDIILVDVPPISIVTDGLVICRHVDYTILVAAAGKTKKKLIIDAKKSIEKVNGSIAGVVLNQMPQEKRVEYSKYYSHYSDEEKGRRK